MTTMAPPVRSIDTEEEVRTTDEPGDAAHIVPPDRETGETSQALVLRARIEGFPVTALCGYTWVPQKSAKGLPVCERCKAIYEHDPKGHGDRDRLPDGD